MTTTPEQAQASLIRERNRWWWRKAADKVRRQDKEAKTGYVPNRADMRANREGGMIWSQRRRPARPSDALIREQRRRALQAGWAAGVQEAAK